MTDGAVIDRLFDALAAGDVAAAVACLAPDAQVWHGFDRVQHDRDAMAAQWAELVTTFPQRWVTDVRRSPTPDGFVQQQVLVVRTASGAALGWPVCLVVTVRDGLIVRIDEYLDRAGHFTPNDRAES